MSYLVSIRYVGVGTAPEDFSAQVARFFAPKSSYVDTAAYAGTVYDTNVDGFGSIDVMEPFASTAIPFPVSLAQFRLASVGSDNEVTFEVSDYKEAFYYKTLGAQLADQGFEVTVGELQTQTFVGTGSATTFTVSAKPAKIIKVTVNNVETSVTYEASTGVVTFETAPASNSTVVVSYSI